MIVARRLLSSTIVNDCVVSRSEYGHLDPQQPLTKIFRETNAMYPKEILQTEHSMLIDISLKYVCSYQMHVITVSQRFVHRNTDYDSFIDKIDRFNTLKRAR